MGLTGAYRHSGAEEASEEKEYDLNDVDDCVQWMLNAWSEVPEEAEPICRYFVESHLRPKVCKGKPLSFWFTSQLISPQLLKTKQGRVKFLEAWKANRATRFSKGPKDLWAKKK